LQWRDIDFERNLISVNPKNDFTPKNGKRRTAPLHPQLREFLLSLEHFDHNYIVCSKDGRRISQCMIRRRLRQVFDSCGLKHMSYHKIRHTFASHLVDSGVSLYKVQNLLGHSSVSTTQIYSHLSQERLKSALEQLPNLV
jgi:site-specific recombinase XerD